VLTTCISSFENLLFNLLYHSEAFKMFLYEFTYDVTADGGVKSRFLHPIFSRYLAGGDASGELSMLNADERQRREAAFFSGSLAIIWFCMDVMLLLHLGFRATLERADQCPPKARFFGWVLAAARLAMIVFIATVFLYEQQPERLALIGLGSTLAQLLLRVVGMGLFPASDEECEEKCFDVAAKYADARVNID